MEEKKLYRFPGLRPFYQEEPYIFFGRDKEVHELQNKIKLEQIIVLFGKSGSGKSSLINTALRNDFVCADWTKYYFTNRLGQSLQQSMLSTFNDDHPEFTENQLIAKLRQKYPDNLWLALKSAFLRSRARTKGVVLVFDQLEELFLLPKSEITGFKYSMTEILASQTPFAFMDYFMTFGHDLSEADFNELTSPIPVKVFFSIRAEYFFHLSEFSDVWPGILRNYLRIDDFSVAQAKDALTGPTTALGAYFSPPFQITEAALNEIIAQLKDPDDRIDPFQLQIVGNALEIAVIQKKLTTIGLENIGSVQHILNDYYENFLTEISASERKQAKILMEDILVQNGIRVLVDAHTLTQRFNISKSLLRKLVDARLLQMDRTPTSVSYEIAHDRLLPSILAIEAEGKQKKLQTDLEIAERKALTQNRKIRMLSWFKRKW